MQNDKPWRYSHTQLTLWKQCKRKYHDVYILGHKEPTTPNMAAGTWLAQAPIEARYDMRLAWTSMPEQDDDYWLLLWANFLAEFGGDDSYDDPIFTLALAKKILAAYKASPVQGKVVEIEHTYEKEFPGGYIYTSRPDLVTEWVPIQKRVTWDIKLKTFNQSRAGDTFFASAPLSPFDDQCLGQAVCAGADAFGQIQFFVGKKDGALVGPVYVEQPVNPVLAQEWELETEIECSEIEGWRRYRGEVMFPYSKNSAACNNYGKPCHRLAACNFGFQEGLPNANSSAS